MFPSIFYVHTKKTIPFFLVAVPKQGNGFDCGLFTCQYAYAFFKIREHITSTSDVLGNTTSLDFLITNNRYMNFNQKIINQFRVQLGKLLDKLSNVYLHGMLGKRKQYKIITHESSGAKKGLKRKHGSKGSTEQLEVITVESPGLKKGGKKKRGSKSSNEQVNNVEPLLNASLGQSIIDSGVVNEKEFVDVKCSIEKDKLSSGDAVSNEQVNNVKPLSNASLGQSIIDSGVVNEKEFVDVKCSDEKEKLSFGAAVKQFFCPCCHLYCKRNLQRFRMKQYHLGSLMC
jgi:hypothetical protein